MLKLKESTIITPVSAETKQTTNETQLKTQACEMATNDLIQKFWDLVNNVTSLATTLDYELEENKTEIAEILNSITDDLTINIGMLYKVVEFLNQKTPELLAAGEEKAEELISDTTEADADATDATTPEIDSETDETAE